MRTGWVFSGLMVLAIGLYLNAVNNEFVFDDLTTFRKTQLTIPEVFHAYRPVRYVSFVLDHAISGNSPAGYHVFNSIYHGLTAFVVFLLLRRLAGSDAAALAGALLFVVHPVHTESVAYISGRRDLLTTLFYLLAFLAYLRSKDSEKRRLFWLAAVIPLFLVARGAKEMAVTLPAILILYDALFDRGVMRKRIPFYALCFVIAIWGTYTGVAGGASQRASSDPTEWEWYGGSPWVTWGTSARLVAYYAWLLLFPLRLVQDYSFDAFPLSRSLDFHTVLALLLIAAAVFGAVRIRDRRPRVSFAIGWFLVTLTPVLHLVPFHELAAEHYLYLPSVGFCLLAGLAFDAARARVPRAAVAVLAVLCLLFAARTVVRNRDWRSSRTIYEATLRDAPRCARATYNLGIVHAKRAQETRSHAEKGRIYAEEALPLLERAVQIDPDYVTAWVQVANVNQALGRQKAARAALLEAARRAEGMRRPPLPVGDIYLLLKDWKAAAASYREDIKRGHRRNRALLGLGISLERLGKDKEALEALEHLLTLDPTHYAATVQAAKLAQKTGDTKRAVALARRARQLRAEKR